MAAASVGPSPPAPVSQTASAMRRTSGAALGKSHMRAQIEQISIFIFFLVISIVSYKL